MPSVTFIVLAHGEDSVFPLFDFLKQHKDAEDKVWVLENPTTPEYTQRLKATGVNVLTHELNKDYAAFRNYAVEKVKTDYLFMIDADEVPNLFLMQNLKKIIALHRNPDAIWTPRLTLVRGIKPIHALQLGWTLSGEVVQWPDMQCRIVRNRRGIKWAGRAHELPQFTKQHRVIGLPYEEQYSITHIKTLDKQLKDVVYCNKEMNCNGPEVTEV